MLMDTFHADALSASFQSPASHWFAGLFRFCGVPLLTALTPASPPFTNLASALTPGHYDSGCSHFMPASACFFPHSHSPGELAETENET